MDKLRIGILAAGPMAHTMADTLIMMDEVIIEAVGSRTLDKAVAFASQYKIEKAYGSYEELVSDENIDMIYVVTPHSHHCQYALLALEHGKHVLCEKAFAVNYSQAKQMTDYAAQRGLLIAEAHWVRYMPMAKQLRRVIASGVIGEITTVTANLSYVISHNPRLVDPHLAGGALLDVGVYPLTFGSLVMGDEIERIEATAKMTDTGVDEQTGVVLYYKSGAMGFFNFGMKSISDRCGFIYGDKGFIKVENNNNLDRITVYDAQRNIIEDILPDKNRLTGYEYEIRACKEAIENNSIECPDMPHREILTMMKLYDAIREKIGLKYPME